VNAYEVEAGMVLFAGKTVQSMPECLWGFITRHCINLRYLYLYTTILLGVISQRKTWWLLGRIVIIIHAFIKRTSSVMILNQRSWQSLGGQHGKGVDGLFEKVSFYRPYVFPDIQPATLNASAHKSRQQQ